MGTNKGVTITMRRPIVLIMLLLGVSLFGGVAVAHASGMQTGKDVYVGADQITDGTAYLAGQTVTMAGTVHGDLFCAGQTVEITGTVDGDVICAAQQLSVKGAVGGDIRVAGQYVGIESKIAGSATVFGQIVSLGSQSTVGTDLTLGAQKATLSGSIGQDVTGGADSLTIAGTVGRTATVYVDQLKLTSTAKTAAITYTSYNDATIEQGATITGAAVRNQPVVTPQTEGPSPVQAKLFALAYWVASMLVVGLAVMLFKPSLLPGTASRVSAEPVAVFGWGLLGLLATPIIIFALLVTFIGVPLGIVVGAVWVIALALAGPLVAHAIGRPLLGLISFKGAEGWQQFLGLLLGLAVIALLSLVPFIGGFAVMLAVIMGIGSLLSFAKHMMPLKVKKSGGK